MMLARFQEGRSALHGCFQIPRLSWQDLLPSERSK